MPRKPPPAGSRTLVYFIQQRQHHYFVVIVLLTDYRKKPRDASPLIWFTCTLLKYPLELLKTYFVFTHNHIDLKVNGCIYMALCLTIFLYGRDGWCLQRGLVFRSSLHYFSHTIRHHPKPSSSSLLKQLYIEPLDKYYQRRIAR